MELDLMTLAGMAWAWDAASLGPWGELARTVRAA